ncbi:MAG: PRC-barrel domain-containing protein, partial [Candidatus Hydrothermarchaeota archaeon]|nr:PRC-barrel domain-containing protein [Candidatus Hydrothermarchaeota archaeon]
MVKIVGKSLIGRNVVSDRGTVIGKLVDMSIETLAGKVMMLIIKPGHDINPKYFRLNDRGEILIPFTAVKAVKDVLIISEGGIPR